MLDLSAQQTRQLIDCEQAYAVYRATRVMAARFAGSMSWKVSKGRDYLYRKTDGVWKSLGPRCDETEQIHARFHEGRDAFRTRRDTLDRRLRDMAPVNRALRLGRVPVTSARLLRKLDEAGLLGRGLKVVGTHALYAYERMGGVHLGEEAVSTMDIDLLYDARRTLKLIGDAPGGNGLIGLLRTIDDSFRPTEPGSFRAANDAGFMVDLIAPAPSTPASAPALKPLGTAADDLVPVEIEGLAWLENVPAIERIAIDERGFPLRMVVPDPRAFLCHKAWLARRDDRDPLKRRRDRHQAHSLARLLATRLPDLTLADPDLAAIPAELRALGAALVDDVRATPVDDEPWDG